MKVEMKNKNTLNFAQLAYGDVFQIKASPMLFMKTECAMVSGNRQINAVCVNSGYFQFVPYDELVTKVEGVYMVKC